MYGIPNPCMSCHTDRSVQWATQCCSADTPLGACREGIRRVSIECAVAFDFWGAIIFLAMRRWLTALTASSLFLLFPFAIGYLPYDHWDHFWPSVNVVFALGLVCVMLGAALVLQRSTISLTRQLLLGTAFLSLLATSLGASVLTVDAQLGRTLFSPHDAITKAIAIAAALAAAIIACSRRWTTRLFSPCSAPLCVPCLSAGSSIPLVPTYSPLRI